MNRYREMVIENLKGIAAGSIVDIRKIQSICNSAAEKMIGLCVENSVLLEEHNKHIEVLDKGVENE